MSDTSSAAAAAADTDQAAARAGVRLLPLDTLAAVREAADLFVRVWRSDPATPPLAAEVMRAVEHAGGYATGAFSGDRMVGASSGFLGLDGERRPVLHSHISGVLDPGRGVGLALKLHQRAWALERGITSITWTFDPLVRRNAWFNLVKLGAVGVEYLPDFYGPMADALNGGHSSDRLFMRWDLTAAAAGPVDGGAAALVLDEAGGEPCPTYLHPAPGTDLLVRLPADIEALRASAPDVARAWRSAVRDVLVPAFASGLQVRAMTPERSLLLRH